MVHGNSTLAITGQEALYLANTYLTDVSTQVIATGRQDNGSPWIALLHNVFHPQGGGQPADRGWVNDVEVTPRRDAGLVLLAARPEETTLAGLSEGDDVYARLDADQRLLHAALHTAGHLVEAACQAEGWTLAGNNHFPGQARIELTPPGTDPQLADGNEREKVVERLRTFVAAAVADDLPITTDQDADGRRIIRVGDVHAAPCGGTHVRSLADLAHVEISAVKQKKGRTRVSYTAQHRSLP